MFVESRVDFENHLRFTIHTKHGIFWLQNYWSVTQIFAFHVKSKLRLPLYVLQTKIEVETIETLHFCVPTAEHSLKISRILLTKEQISIVTMLTYGTFLLRTFLMRKLFISNNCVYLFSLVALIKQNLGPLIYNQSTLVAMT